MRDVAAEAGVAQGLVHYYFVSKEALLLAVVRAMLDEQLARLRRELASVPASARALAGLAAARDRALGDKRAWRLFFEVLASPSRGETGGALASAFRDRRRAVADEIATAGRELGVRPDTLALLLDALLLGLAAERLAGATDGEIEAAYDAFVRLLTERAGGE